MANIHESGLVLWVDWILNPSESLHDRSSPKHKRTWAGKESLKRVNVIYISIDPKIKILFEMLLLLLFVFVLFTLLCIILICLKTKLKLNKSICRENTLPTDSPIDSYQ